MHWPGRNDEFGYRPKNKFPDGSKMRSPGVQDVEMENSSSELVDFLKRTTVI
jgi:hypothetical protein